jgi:hypothetical protein
MKAEQRKGTQQPGNVGAPKQEETSSRTSKRPRPEGSTPTDKGRLPKSPRDSNGPGIYKEALTKMKRAILKEKHPEDTLTEDYLPDTVT